MAPVSAVLQGQKYKAPGLRTLCTSLGLKPADELYSFLWTLWRHQSDGVSHETRLLFDTVMWRTGPEGTFKLHLTPATWTFIAFGPGTPRVERAVTVEAGADQEISFDLGGRPSDG